MFLFYLASVSIGFLLPFPMQIISTFWKFYQTQPGNSSLVAVSHAGMQYTEMIIFALVEILHAFIATDSSYVPMITELYIDLLLCQVSVAVFFFCLYNPAISSAFAVY